jgi:hypothetical protein
VTTGSKIEIWSIARLGLSEKYRSRFRLQLALLRTCQEVEIDASTSMLNPFWSFSIHLSNQGNLMTPEGIQGLSFARMCRIAIAQSTALSVSVPPTALYETYFAIRSLYHVRSVGFRPQRHPYPLCHSNAGLCILTSKVMARWDQKGRSTAKAGLPISPRHLQSHNRLTW